MIDGLRPYPEMKPSGLPWLPELPAGWEIHRAKYSFREANDRSDRGEEELLSVSHKTGVTPRSQKNITMFMAESYEGYKVCRPGDIVVNTMWAWMAALGVSQHVGIVSSAYGVYRLRSTGQFEPRYLDYLLRTETYRAEYLRSSRGVTTSRLRLYPPDFLKIPFVQPPPDEQRLIVRFLDWHGGQTTKLIRAKRKLIALLNEQKQAIIHRAVTHGLDPNVKLRSSGVEWIGDIPDHWNVRRLSTVAHFQSGKAHEPFFVPNGDHIAVTARFVSTNGTARKYCTQNFSPAAFGDILMVMSDLPNGRALARAYLVNDQRSYAVNQRVCTIRPIRMEPQFLAWQLNRNWGLLRHDDRRNQTHLSNNDFKTLPVLCPPRAEQEGIVRSIAESIFSTDALVDSTEHEIALIQEFRARLIADAITGKLDVRAAAANLHEVTELEAIDEPTDGEDLDEVVDDAESEEVAA